MGISDRISAADVVLDLDVGSKRALLQDLAAGRQTEIESICGQICQSAAALGLPAPLNATLTTLVRAAERQLWRDQSTTRRP